MITLLSFNKGHHRVRLKGSAYIFCLFSLFSLGAVVFQGCASAAPGQGFLDFVAGGDVAQARLALAAGADVNQLHRSGSNALIIATYNKDIAMVQFLVESGIRLCFRRPDGISALLVARKIKDQSIYEYLKALGARKLTEKGIKHYENIYKNISAPQSGAEMSVGILAAATPRPSRRSICGKSTSSATRHRKTN